MNNGMMSEEKTKSFAVSKEMVYNSYLKVCSKDGGAGIDKETIEMFNKDLNGNLYKVWNRMSSGSYFPPPVRTVLIQKKQGGTRPLGIPTVGDRIAQGVVKDEDGEPSYAGEVGVTLHRKMAKGRYRTSRWQYSCKVKRHSAGRCDQSVVSQPVPASCL